MAASGRGNFFALLAPGILVAATGVGAGDIAGAAFAGSRLGYAIVWAAILGAAVKFVLNEGLMRWQLATGRTLLEGSVQHFGRPVQWLFLIYLLIWSYGVGAALISATGAAAHALVPVFDNPQVGKAVWGIGHSLATVAFIFIGGYQRFEKLMTVLLVVMVGCVIATAIAMKPDWSAVARGFVSLRLPRDAGGMQWTLALIGGVGGTVTMLCYGYWIREQGRGGPEFLRICRIDLAVSYAVTAIFGASMVIIATGMNLSEGGGATLMIKLANQLGATLGAPAKYIFLVGGWAAIFTSMLGVWQAVPYLFCDLLRLMRGSSGANTVDTRSAGYRAYLLGLAILPMLGLAYSFEFIQKTYAMLGALFLPLTAVALLILNRRALVGAYGNRPWTVAALAAVLAFLVYAIYMTVKLGLSGNPLLS